MEPKRTAEQIQREAEEWADQHEMEMLERLLTERGLPFHRPTGTATEQE